MKRILALALTAMMIVSCFAFSANATAVADDVVITFENAYEGSTEMAMVFTYTWTDDTAADANTVDIYFFYDDSVISFTSAEAITGIKEGGSFNYGTDDTSDFFAISSTDVVASVAGQEMSLVIKAYFNVIGSAGDVVTFTDDGGFAYFSGTEVYNELEYTVEIEEAPGAAVTATAPVALGAQIKTTDTQGLRFGFSLDKTAESYAQIAEKGIVVALADGLAELTLENAAADVAVTKYLATDDSSETFTVCVKDIPESAYDTEIAARAYIVLEDGTTVYSDTIVKTVNGVADASGWAN